MRWCLRLDRALNDDERWNMGCVDDMGTHHKCDGCLHNQYMSEGSAIVGKVYSDY